MMPELSPKDQGAILNLFQQYGDAWGRRDARGCAALFAADGDLIAADGEVCAGPDAIGTYYNRQLSGPYKDLTVSDIEVGAIRPLGTDTAVMNGSWFVHGLPGPGGRSRPGVRIQWTLVVRRDTSGWRYVVARFMAALEMGAAVDAAL
jgi:uncharacterized protein (TIGR02246 family)